MKKNYTLVKAALSAAVLTIMAVFGCVAVGALLRVVCWSLYVGWLAIGKLLP